MAPNTITWISHRGLCQDAVENTSKAFDAAVEAGFLAFETDLRATKDGAIVLCHDLSFGRLGGPDKNISEMARAEVDQVTLRDGSKPLFFEEFMKSYAGYSWTFDIKKESFKAVVDALFDWADRLDAHSLLNSQARVLCWSAEDEAYLKKMFPTLQTLAQKGECWRSGLAALFNLPGRQGVVPGRIYSVTPELKGIKLFVPRIARYYHQRGAKILAYLPDSHEKARWAIDAGFDEVLSNLPPLS